jgi:hypothetical protein
LENQEKALRESAAHSSFSINEAADTNAGNAQNFDPVLIALVRRAMPSLIAYDVAGFNQFWSNWSYLLYGCQVWHQ